MYNVRKGELISSLSLSLSVSLSLLLNSKHTHTFTYKNKANLLVVKFPSTTYSIINMLKLRQWQGYY